MRITPAHLALGVVALIVLLVIFLADSTSQITDSAFSFTGIERVPGDHYVRPANSGHPTVLDDSVNVKEDVAWAIPICCNNLRAEALKTMIKELVSQGVKPSNIFVFDDDVSRKGDSARSSTDELEDWLRLEGVTLHKSGIVRTEGPEGRDTFGTYLGRHYHFMADTLFLGNHDSGYGSTTVVSTQRRTFEYVVFMEDDLLLAKDVVKYFHEMARVMAVDQSLFCVSAHVDNAFFATSYNSHGDATNTGVKNMLSFQVQMQQARQAAMLEEREFDMKQFADSFVEIPVPDPNYLDPKEFHFRRGNHFMAPGWMSSKEIYLNIIRPSWLDAETGNYMYKDALHLPNGHWDRFWDSRIGPRDCIFPEVPRILHAPAKKSSFTVSDRAQKELYEGLRLASADGSKVDYGSLSYLTNDGYDKATREFLQGAYQIYVPEQMAGSTRNEHFKLRVAAKNDQDPIWNYLINRYFGLIGVGGYGGYEGYVKLRGVKAGTVLIRWMTNTVMLVADYSPYVTEFHDHIERDRSQWGPEELEHMAADKILHPGVPIFAGCFKDSKNVHFPHHVDHYTAKTLNPTHCLLSCLMLGYPFGALRNANECRCGAAAMLTADDRAPDDTCNKQCVNPNPLDPDDGHDCGGTGIFFSVFATVDTPYLLQPPMSAMDTRYIIAEPGASCETACAEMPLELNPRDGSTVASECREELFARVSSRCDMLEYVTQSKCSSCSKDDIINAYAPVLKVNRDDPDNPTMDCFTQMPPRISCEAEPKDRTLQRVCVCAAFKL